ncbi:MAG: type II toxin-antitoxin system PemK/MazF family toxin [Methylococcaceae bacterium]
MTNFEIGAIVLIAFPFTDQTGSKRRPAVVISSKAYQEAKPDIILMAVTSQVKTQKLLGEVIIDEWKAAGLLKPSVIKPVIFTAEKRLIRKTLGQLKQVDIQQLKQNLTVIIG